MASSSCKVAVGAVLLLSSLAAFGAPSSKYQDWRKGPTQWIMTPEEERAWKSVSTDEQAVEFIDLFWARRDPSPNTPQNEFRDEFLGRVNRADVSFKERNRRGALTDRGRVFIVLGNPTTGSDEEGYSSTGLGGPGASAAGTGGGGGGIGAAGSSGPGNATASTAHQQGGRTVWTWTGADARKFNMPKIEVVFVEQVGTGRIARDVQRRDYLGAEPVAIRKAIVNPGLTTVPDWAAHGGLEPRMLVFKPAPPSPATPAVEPLTTPAATIPVPAAPDASVPVLQPAGASRLTLLRDVYAVETETRVDPFSEMQPVTTFHAGEEMGWAAQYCSGSLDEPTVRFSLRVTGQVGNELIDRKTPEDEIVPDRIKVLAGCYMLRGAIPLENMAPGNYQLELTMSDAATGARHVLTQPFVVK